MGMSTLYQFPFGTEVNPWLAVARINAQAASLVTQRAQAYLEFSAGLGNVKTTDDFLTQQVSFWQIAQRQYLESVQKSVLATLPALGMDGPTEAPPKKGAPRDYMVVQDVVAVAAKSEVDLSRPKSSAPERLRRTA